MAHASVAEAWRTSLCRLERGLAGGGASRTRRGGRGARKDEEVQVKMMQALFNRVLWERGQTCKSICIGMRDENQQREMRNGEEEAQV